MGIYRITQPNEDGPNGAGRQPIAPLTARTVAQAVREERPAGRAGRAVHNVEGNRGLGPRSGDDDNEADDDGFHELLDRHHPGWIFLSFRGPFQLINLRRESAASINRST